MTQTIKNNSDYSTDVGKQFDIIGEERQIDESKAKPILKAKKTPYGWEFSFGLDDYYSGVSIYRKYPDDADFSFIATDTHSPYLDNKQMINGTKYYAYYLRGDLQVGLQSDEVTIKV